MKMMGTTLVFNEEEYDSEAPLLFVSRFGTPVREAERALVEMDSGEVLCIKDRYFRTPYKHTKVKSGN